MPAVTVASACSKLISMRFVIVAFVKEELLVPFTSSRVAS